ncbi:MAG: hypothetical protein ACFCU5_04580 [Pleurocapsa sp.]
MKIDTLVGINNYTLVIYAYPDGFYRFCIIDSTGIPYNFDSMFLTAEEANQKGKDAVNLAYEFDLNEYQF